MHRHLTRHLGFRNYAGLFLIGFSTCFAHNAGARQNIAVSNPGDGTAVIQVSPADQYGNDSTAGGVHNFTFADNASITLTAPEKHKGRAFSHWQVGEAVAIGAPGVAPEYKSRVLRSKLTKGNYFFVAHYQGEGASGSKAATLLGATPEPIRPWVRTNAPSQNQNATRSGPIGVKAPSDSSLQNRR